MTDSREPRGTPPDAVRTELDAEQEHVDRVYRELEKAERRAALVQADGMARGRTERVGDMRDEELAGLFERDALVHTASRRQAALERQHEGLVFGRLDLAHDSPPEREIRYVGRLGVRDDDYEPLVIDWRAPAAAPFYRATPKDPLGVIRRRVLRCRGSRVVGAEDDLMVPEAPEDLVVLGEGALLAALTRSRDGHMRDIVATIQAHQDQAIRAPARGVVELTGGPGTGKTVVALHRAAFLLYSDRRRFENGGILVVGPSAAYTAYIERVLPSLGEESVVLRSLGDVVEAMTGSRHDPPPLAHVKGSLRIRRVLARLAAEPVPGAPTQVRLFVLGRPVRLEPATLSRIASRVLRGQRRNAAREAVANALADAAWAADPEGDRAEFRQAFLDHREVEAFLDQWWPPVDPRQVLLWLADPAVARRCSRGILTDSETDALSASFGTALDSATWSVADVALVDDLFVRLGPPPEVAEERGFYEIEQVDDILAEVVGLGHLRPEQLTADQSWSAGSPSGKHPSRGAAQHDVATNRSPTEEDRLEALLRGRMEEPAEYAHVLVDEAQDVSPMQWRMLARRGRWASWTVVGDQAQAAWPDPAEADQAKSQAFGSGRVATFHMPTNYRNSREIFAYAADVIRAEVPDADIPDAVRETGHPPAEVVVTVSFDAVNGEPDDHEQDAVTPVVHAVTEAVDELASAVEGAVSVIAPARWRGVLSSLAGGHGGRVVVSSPLSTKGLEFDATVVVDPEEIRRESPGGVRALYVVLTRAAHRMCVIRLQQAPR